MESDGSHAFSYSTKTPGDYVIAATVAGAHMQVILFLPMSCLFNSPMSVVPYLSQA